MIQNTQMLRAALATLRREITAISDLIVAPHSSEHWNVANTQTSDRHVRNPSARVARSVRRALVALTPVIAVVSCNVYDSSLLDAASTGTGADGGGLILAGGGSQASSGAGPTLGGKGGVADDNGGSSAAGADNAGDSSLGGATGGGSTGGSSGGSAPVAGAGGGTTTAGGGGSGGAPNVNYSVIDDFENPDYNIPGTDGRMGFWSLSNDGTKTGVQTPMPVTMSLIAGGRGSSLYALHTTAMGFVTSGAQVGVDLNRKTTRSTYDASPYVAVHFWIKATVAPPVIVHFAMIDKHTDPDGGLCCVDAMCKPTGAIANGLCYNHFGTDITPAPTTAWEERTVSFAALTQGAWTDNKENAVDAAHVYALQFSWPSAAMDLWIDDISFVKK